MVAKSQPIKLAAMEGLYETQRRAPLHIGGVPDNADRRLAYAIAIPGGLSWLAYGDINAEVKGLNEFPEADLPPVAVVHYAFQIMVAIGTLMMFVALWCGFNYCRMKAWPRSRFFLWLIVSLGPLSILAMEAGWVVTEVGRQPWIVHGYMRTTEAVTQAPGVWKLFMATLAIYFIIGVGTVLILRQLARLPLPENPHGA